MPLEAARRSARLDSEPAHARHPMKRSDEARDGAIGTHAILTLYDLKVGR